MCSSTSAAPCIIDDDHVDKDDDHVDKDDDGETEGKTQATAGLEQGNLPTLMTLKT